MISIVVTIPQKSLPKVEQEEQEVASILVDDPNSGVEYFWEMGVLPEKNPDRIYFLWDKAVRAYHNVRHVEVDGIGQFRYGRIWMAPQIIEVDPPIPMNPFRGFRYFNPPPTREVSET